MIKTKKCNENYTLPVLAFGSILFFKLKKLLPVTFKDFPLCLWLVPMNVKGIGFSGTGVMGSGEL